MLQGENMILIIDNYDSFTYNLVQLVSNFSNEILVYRNDEITLEKIDEMNISHIILSPGPGKPTVKRDFGICKKILENIRNIPILGVCLGHQGIFVEYGGNITKSLPVHGKKDIVIHEESLLFKDVPNEFDAIRYHSLICDKTSIPNDLKVTSYTSDGIIMSIEHKNYPVYGIQFHPESLGSSYGERIISNFLDMKVE